MGYFNESFQKNRIMRVFISSTFQDMHLEREKLIKEVFPKLKKECEKRGVHFCEVDLRWGVVEDQTALPVCLSEIDRSNVFIGILGERYGYIPTDFNDYELEEREWLKEYNHRSITELEIIQGAFIDKDRPSYFYFGQNIHTIDIEEEDEVSKEKLVNLKQLIEQEKSFQYYQNVEELGNWVYDDLMGLLDEMYPYQTVKGIEKEILEHDLYAVSKSQLIVKRQNVINKMNDWLNSKDGVGPLVLLGESGAGKSSLVAEWGYSLKENNKDFHVIMHFIGATGQSSSLLHMIQRIVTEFKMLFHLQNDIDENYDNIDEILQSLLLRIPENQQLILILDAINQLDNLNNEINLNWLPEILPNNVKILITSTKGVVEPLIKKKGYEIVEVTQLVKEEIIEVIRNYFQFYGKKLPDGLDIKISEHSNSTNPLFLKTLLEELRIYGSYSTLGKTLEDYLESKSIDDLYDKILGRFEIDYGYGNEQVVHRIMRMLWTSRRGLYENELLELAGRKGNPLSQAIWSPLHRAIEGSLISRMGQLNFSHDFFRTAIEKRYLSSDEEKNKVYNELIAFFKQDEKIERQLEELPWLYIKTKNWQQLYELLTDLQFFSYLWENNSYEVAYFWKLIESNTRYTNQLTIMKAYSEVIQNPNNFKVEELDSLALFMYQHHPKEAIKLIEYLSTYYREKNDNNRYHFILHKKATVLLKQGEYLDALRILEEQEQYFREQKNNIQLQIVLGSVAEIHLIQGYWEKSLEAVKEQFEICKLINHREGILASYGLLGKIEVFKNSFEEGIVLFNKQYELAEQIGNLEEKASALRSLVDAHLFNRQIEKSEECMSKYKELSVRIINPYIEQEEYYLNARLHIVKENYDEAMSLLKEQEKICSDISYYPGLATSYGLQAMVIKDKRKAGLIKKAARKLILDLYDKQEKICRERGLHEKLQICLNKKAIELSGNPSLINDALILVEEQIDICKEIKHQLGLYHAYTAAFILSKKNYNYEQAYEYLELIEQIPEQLSRKKYDNYLNYIRVLRELDSEKYIKGKQLLLELEEVSIREGNIKKYIQFLNEFIQYLAKDGYIQYALRIFDVQIDMIKKSNQKPGMVYSNRTKFRADYKDQLKVKGKEIQEDNILYGSKTLRYLSNRKINEVPFFDDYVENSYEEKEIQVQQEKSNQVKSINKSDLTNQQIDLIYLIGKYGIRHIHEFIPILSETIEGETLLVNKQTIKSLLNDLVDKSVLYARDISLNNSSDSKFEYYQLTENGKKIFKDLAPSLKLVEKQSKYSFEETYMLEELSKFLSLTRFSFYSKLQEDMLIYSKFQKNMPEKFKKYFPNIDGLIETDTEEIPFIISHKDNKREYYSAKMDYMYNTFGYITIISYGERSLYLSSKPQFWDWIINRSSDLNSLDKPVVVKFAELTELRKTGVLRLEKLTIINKDNIVKEEVEIELASIEDINILEDMVD